MFNGIVKNFDLEKGYGFIQPTDGSVAIFVNAKTVVKSGLETLKKGQKLIFDRITNGFARH